MVTACMQPPFGDWWTDLFSSLWGIAMLEDCGDSSDTESVRLIVPVTKYW